MVIKSWNHSKIEIKLSIWFVNVPLRILLPLLLQILFSPMCTTRFVTWPYTKRWLLISSPLVNSAIKNLLFTLTPNPLWPICKIISTLVYIRIKWIFFTKAFESSAESFKCFTYFFVGNFETSHFTFNECNKKTRKFD